jgi:hypothetical protein
MACTPIYCFSAPKGKYLEPATLSHPIEAEGYEIRPDFISFARELNLWGRRCCSFRKSSTGGWR